MRLYTIKLKRSQSHCKLGTFLRMIMYQFNSSESFDLPENHEWRFVCSGSGTDNGICLCMGCDGQGHLAEIAKKKKALGLS